MHSHGTEQLPWVWVLLCTPLCDITSWEQQAGACAAPSPVALGCALGPNDVKLRVVSGSEVRTRTMNRMLSTQSTRCAASADALFGETFPSHSPACCLISTFCPERARALVCRGQDLSGLCSTKLCRPSGDPQCELEQLGGLSASWDCSLSKSYWL